ncbi:MAG TPA: peptidogalycan biosysnthesis protein [Solimonas sp.]
MAADSLFTQPAYLEPLIDSGCVGPETGWTPLAPPGVYRKAHSWGEFVFDHAFAEAYARHGLDYYPKLTVCTPFTPVPASRVASREQAGALQALATEQAASGVHALFLPEQEARQLEQAGWLRREQARYVWRQRGHADFDGFLAALNHKRRKNIRHERRQIAEAGYRIEWRRAAELDAALWTRVFAHYVDTYRARGMAPYLNLDCLRRWARVFPEAFWFCLAFHGDDCVAMAWYFEDGDRLCGRHWGSDGGHALLHFELCCYQGIARAIERGLSLFDAGVQGTHKLLRGFDAERSHSAHWFAHEGFREAIGRYLQRERIAIGDEVSALAAHSGYRHVAIDEPD